MLEKILNKFRIIVSEVSFFVGNPVFTCAERRGWKILVFLKLKMRRENLAEYLFLGQN